MLTRLALGLLRWWTPAAERHEVIGDLSAEHAARRLRGRAAADAWLWSQVVRSLPALVRRSWWRGWSGFEPDANRHRPGGPGMESWIMDVRYAARRLLTRPTYAVLAVVTLALGVGGTAAIFSIVRGLLFQPLPVAHEENLTVFWNQFDWSEAEFTYLKPQFSGFEAVAMWRPTDVTLESPGEPARLLRGIASSAELLDMLGARAMLGRTYHSGEDQPGVEDVIVISHGLWRQLGSDSSIIGRRLKMAGLDCTVVGVMARDFWFPDPQIQIWFPATLNPNNRSGNYALIARVPPGASEGQIAGSLAHITRLLGERFTYSEQWDKTKNAQLTPLREYLLGSLRPGLLTTTIAMSLILLIASANVAALMLGQVQGRTAELAVRTALGADRRRLTQQLIAEALLVGSLAGLAGAALAAGGFRLLVTMLPLGAMAGNATLDWPLFAAAIAIALVAAAGIALVPVMSLWRGDVRGALSRVRASSEGGRGSRMEGALVVGQVALAVLLATGSALLIRSVSRLYAIDPGMNTDQVAVVDVTMPLLMPRLQRQQAIPTIAEALGALPGVASASAIHKLPLTGRGDSWGLRVPSHPEIADQTTYFRIIGQGYFETMGYRLVSGRFPNAGDNAQTQHAVVINQALAERFFPGEDPVGRLAPTFDSSEIIVGVVANAAEAGLTDSAAPARYMLYEQIPYTPASHSFVLRLEPGVDAAPVLAAARRTVQELMPQIAVEQVTTMSRVFSLAVGPARQLMGLLGILTGLAMILGAVGVYGVISQFVERRRRDWGIRIALGLAPLRLLRQVVSRGVALVAVGAGLGLAGALLGARVLRSFLYGVGTADPLALAGATLALLTVGLLAAFAPAWRASRVHPASVLREQ